MARYVGKVTSPKAIEEVFAYMADFSNVSEWDPSAVEARAIHAKTGAKLGARYAVTSRFLGRDTQLIYDTVALERPDRVVLRGENESVVSLDEISFRKLPDGGTELTYDAFLQLKGARRLLDPVFGLAFKRLCERARDRMSEVLGG
jgi:hypothetical protein